MAGSHHLCLVNTKGPASTSTAENGIAGMQDYEYVVKSRIAANPRQACNRN
jgi:hypothetical protein